MEKDYTYKGKEVNPITENPKHNNKVNSKEERKEERDLSHFDYLKKYYSKEIDIWSIEEGINIYDKNKFLKAFNNKMNLQDYERSKKLLYRFNEYSRHWINYQNENKKPTPIPVYLRNCQ